MKPEQAAAVRAIAEAVVEAVEGYGKNGIPAGHLYAMLMNFGCTLEVFNKLMGTLVKVGKVRKEGLRYFGVNV